MTMSNIQLLFGPLLIGTFLSTILYGVVVVQAFIYYQTYKRDPTWIRYFILYLVICETLNTAFDIGMMYEPLVMRYATPRATTDLPTMLLADPIMTVFISTPVQLFISWRIKTLTGSKLLPSVICFFAFCALIGGIATTVAAVVFHKFAKVHQYDGAVVTWLASSAAADICITACLVWSLHQRRTGYSATDDLLNKLIRLTLQTGAITALSATLDVTLFLAAPNTTLNFIWNFSLSKLYTNSLLSTLNARAGWNNLTGDARYQDNVLFGESKGTLPIHKNTPQELSNSYSATALELKVRSNTKYPNPFRLSESDKRQNESGISVTKVVERFEDIPSVGRS